MGFEGIPRRRAARSPSRRMLWVSLIPRQIGEGGWGRGDDPGERQRAGGRSRVGREGL